MTWLYVPGTSSPSAPASADWSSASELPNPERAELCTWRGKPQPPQAWSRAWKRGGFIRLLSGLMQEPSTLDRGAASFIASLRATHASLTASPEKGSAPTTAAGSSTSFSASSTSAGLIVSSARTCRGTPPGNSPPSSRHWSEWATALRAESSARPRSAPAIVASGCSLWPTARTPSGGPESAERKKELGRTESGGGDLQAAVLMWPTPDASVANDGEGPETWRARQARIKEKGINGNGAGVPLTIAAQETSWSTPRCTDGEKGGPNQSFGAGGTPLPSQAAQWMTPNVPNGGRSASFAEKEGATLYHEGRKVQLDLSHQVRQWPTPNCADGKTSPDYPHKGGNPTLVMAAVKDFRPSPPDPQTPAGPASSPERRSLNPLFVEWLMGWPTGLSGFERAETAFSPWLRQMRGCLSALLSSRTAEPEQGRLL